MSELHYLRGQQDPSIVGCGLVPADEAAMLLTRMSLNVFTAALRHDGPLPSGLEASNSMQWRASDGEIDVHVQQSAPLGQQMGLEDLGRSQSLVGVTIHGKNSVVNIAEFTVTPTVTTEGACVWEDSGALEGEPPLTTDQFARAQRLFDDIRSGRVPTKVIESAYAKLADTRPDGDTYLLSILADRLHTGNVTRPGLIVRAFFELAGFSRPRFYADICKDGLIVDYKLGPPAEGAEAPPSNPLETPCWKVCKEGRVALRGASCVLRHQLARDNSTVLPAEVLKSVLARGDQALGMLAVRNFAEAHDTQAADATVGTIRRVTDTMPATSKCPS